MVEVYCQGCGSEDVLVELASEASDADLYVECRGCGRAVWVGGPA